MEEQDLDLDSTKFDLTFLKPQHGKKSFFVCVFLIPHIILSITVCWIYVVSKNFDQNPEQ
jgi:hypothetical protein